MNRLMKELTTSWSTDYSLQFHFMTEEAACQTRLLKFPPFFWYENQ